MWIIELLIVRPSPIPELQHAPTRPSTPHEVLQAKEHASILSPSIVFTFGLAIESIKELGGALWGDFPSLYSRFYKVIMHGSTNATNEGRIQM
jgi:hypothetical protein